MARETFVTQKREKGHSNSSSQYFTSQQHFLLHKVVLQASTGRKIRTEKGKKGNKIYTITFILLQIHAITKYKLLQFNCNYNIAILLQYYYISIVLQKVTKKVQKRFFNQGPKRPLTQELKNFPSS